MTLRFFFCIAFCSGFSCLHAQYSENFNGQNGKGLVSAVCPAGTTSINSCGSTCTSNTVDNIANCSVAPPSFAGVNWNIVKGPSTTYFTNLAGIGFEFGSPDDFGVVSDKMEVQDPDQELCWVSPLLNIASAGVVSIAIDVSQAGGLDAGDYIRGEYSLNGAGFTVFETQSGAFATTQLNTSGLSGTTLTVRVCALTNGGGEQIFFDNVSVPQAGVTIGCAAPVITATPAPTGSCNPNTGSILVGASNGTPGYNVAWSGPANGNPGGVEIASSGGSYNISSLAAGTYTITVTDAASCSATTTATVATATALSLGTQVLDADCPGASTGEIDLAVSNGVPPYTYDWDNLAGPNEPQDQTGLAAGAYTVTVTDAANCTSTASATVGTATPGAYQETFSIAGKGILDGSTCSGANGTTCTVSNFAGVNWSIYGLSTLSGVDVNDYFKTVGGKLEHKDIDQDVCWESPNLDINPPGSGVSFSVDLAWLGFDHEPAPDYLDVEYSTNNGGLWTRVANQVGGGTSGHTIVYANGAGTSNNGSTTVTVSGISGSTLRIRVCGLANEEGETFTIDNVSVAQAQGFACPCPAISFTATPTNTCSGGSTGQIAVTGVTGGTGPYLYSKDNGSTFQSGNTFTGLAANTYQIVVKDAAACTGGPSATVVGTNVQGSCTLSGAASVCTNSTGNVFSADAGQSAYNWSISGNGTITSATNGASVTVTAGASGSFTLNSTVTDANGCTSVCSKEVTIGAPTPCSITGPDLVCNSSTGITYSAPAGMSSYNWAISGGGSIPGSTTGSSVEVSTGNFAENYTVFLTITNSSGCTSTCSMQSFIFLFNPPLDITASPDPVCVGATLDLSIAAASSSTVSWTGEGITDPDGNFIPDGFGGYYNQTTAIPTTAGLHTYSVTVTTDYGCSNTDQVTVTVNPRPAVTCPSYPSPVCNNAPAFALSGGTPPGGTYSGPGVSSNMFNPANAGPPGVKTITYSVTDGGCSNSCSFTITVNTCLVDIGGTIVWEKDDVTGVGSATVTLSGDASGSQTTPAAGTYGFSGLVGTNFTLTPTKTINKMNGVNVADATAIQQHLANIAPITDPYKLIAADVNKSNSVSAVDASIISQSILGNPSALQQFKTSWRFTPATPALTNPPWGFAENAVVSNPVGNQTVNFIGIKTGDVNGTANPAGLGAGETLVLNVQDRVLEAGAEVTAEFEAGQQSDLAAFQLGLRFDPARLQFVEVQPLDGLPLTADNFGLYEVAAGEIRALWSQPAGTSLAEATPLFRLKFQALQGGVSLSEALALDEDVVPAHAYNGMLAEAPVELSYQAVTGTGSPAGATDVQLLQNRPNPFNGTTTIPFVLPRECDATLRITAATGQLLFEQQKHYPAGRHEETLYLPAASGVLYVELVTEQGSVVRRMLAVR